jgi:hypothetical protein
MKAADRLGDVGVRPTMGSHGGCRHPGRLLQQVKKEGNVSCEMGLREGRGRERRWLPPRAGESGGESADSGEVVAYGGRVQTLGKEEGGGEVRAVWLG